MIAKLALGSCGFSLTKFDFRDFGDSLSVFRLILGGFLDLCTHTLDLSLGCLQQILLSPVRHDSLDVLWLSELLSIITKTLFCSVWSWISVRERFRGTSDGARTVGIDNGIATCKNIIEVSELFIVVNFGGKINVTIASAIIALRSASRCFILRLDFTEALFVLSWHWVTSKINC